MPSLRRRLSVWLALQGLVVMATICTVVLIDTRAGLQARQEETLANKRVQVLHLLDEARDTADFAPLRHKLDDFFVGHDEVSLEILGSNGNSIYQSRSHASLLAGERLVRFDVPALRSTDGALKAVLHLDTRGDTLMLRRLAATLVLAAVGVSALASITGYLLVRTGLDPIRHLARQAGSLGADTLHRRLSSARQPQELLPLVEQFNALLSRLGDAYTQLEAFNSDVAHELKTPLATLISGCELALRRPRNSAELEEQIASNLEDLHRLSAIVQDMLFLSHADQGSRARRLPVQSFAALAASVVEYHDAAIQAAGLNVEVHGDASGAFDAALLQRALSNLLMNATRYGSPGSTIRILIAATAGSRELSFSVKNEGPGIDPVDLPKVFDRFFRGDKSRSAGQQQHGLGLAIVAAIARMHDGRAFATSSGGTTEVGMRLPIPA